MFGPDFIAYEVMKPRYFISILVIFMGSIYSLLLSFLCFILANDLVYFFVLFTFLFSVLIPYRFYIVNTALIKTNIRNEYELSLSNNVQDIFKVNKLIFAPILTLMFGIVSFFVLSLKDGSFLTNSKVDYPLLAVPTIYIGDLILLPLINYSTAKLVFEYKEFIKKFFKQWRFKAVLFLSLCIATFFNIKTHKVWEGDNFNGFIDMNQKLTTAGQIHLVFSIINMFVILFIILISIYAYLNKYKVIFNKTIDIWKYLIAFSSLSILDFLYRYYFMNFNNEAFGLFLKSNSISFLLLYFSLAVFLTLKILQKRIR
ncbi:hypothetical protein IPJ91_01260 [bacterium]|nr:MAG: hypothetical protein IPJ91_01260 [bacterium]